MPNIDWDDEITPPPIFRPPAGARAEAPAPPRPSPAPVRVLLIEESRAGVGRIQELLSQVSGFACQVESADRLAAGLNRLARGGIDLVLLSLSLPDVPGLEAFQRLHTLAARVPVVVLSSRHDENLAITAVQKGAQDYLVKGPMDASQLVRAIRYGIERNRRRLAEQTLRATQVKLQMARQIQQKLFPAGPPPLDGFDLAGASVCAEATGGDYFDYIPMAGGGLGIAIADVTGHGFGPALIMASARAYLRALSQTGRPVAEVLALANQFLMGEVGDDSFITLLLARLDPCTRTLAYASAGHPSGYVLDQAGNVRALLPSTGLPLGIDPGAEFMAGPVVSLLPGDVVLLLTDGIAEARSAADTAFGVERTLNVLRHYRHRSAQEIITALHRAVRDFCLDKVPVDDITAIVLKVAPR